MYAFLFKKSKNAVKFVKKYKINAKSKQKSDKIVFFIFYFNFLPIFFIILIKNKPKIIWLIF